jgi:site-specific DNA-methyltransferase (adenine-specific)
MKKIKYYINKSNFKLIDGDSFEILKSLKKKSFSIIFADPPYFLSDGGISVKSGKMVKVDKGNWDKAKDVNEKIEYNRKWISLCKPLLKENGSIWISGTFHNIYTIAVALELEGYEIINNITIRKLNPPPNISGRAFAHSTETLIWARIKGSKHKFNYKLMKEINGGKQMKDVWEFTQIPRKEKDFGYHPTQKTLELLKRIIIASTDVGDTVLDPFSGTSTTGIASIILTRKFIGIENELKYLMISSKRFYNVLRGEKNDKKKI